jgi:hypothetical protein
MTRLCFTSAAVGSVGSFTEYEYRMESFRSFRYQVVPARNRLLGTYLESTAPEHFPLGTRHFGNLKSEQVHPSNKRTKPLSSVNLSPEQVRP